MQDKLIGIREAAELLNLSEKTLRNWDNSGKFVAVKTKGGHRRYRLSDIHSFQGNNLNKIDKEFQMRESIEILFTVGSQEHNLMTTEDMVRCSLFKGIIDCVKDNQGYVVVGDSYTPYQLLVRYITHCSMNIQDIRGIVSKISETIQLQGIDINEINVTYHFGIEVNKLSY